MTDLLHYAPEANHNDVRLTDPEPAPAGSALIHVPVAALVLTGPAPTFLKSNLVRITPPVGPLRLAGPYQFDTTILRFDAMNPTWDTLVQREPPRVLIQPSPIPGTGALTLTGYAPIVIISHNVPQGGGGMIPMPLEARRLRTRVIEIDEELLGLLALNPTDEDMLLLLALANYEPQ